MTVLFVSSMTDGLDNLGKFDNFTGGSYAAPNRHGTGPNTMQFTTGSTSSGSVDSRWGHLLDPTRFTIAAGCAHRHNGQAGQTRSNLLHVRNSAGTIIARVHRNATESGTFTFHDRTGAEIASVSGVGTSTWQAVSFRIAVNESTPEEGAWQFWLGDVFVAQGLADFGDLPVGEVAMSNNVGGIASGKSTQIQDFWITDGELLYDCRIQQINLTAPGDLSEWEPADELADNYEEVSTPPHSDDSFVSTELDNQTDLYQHAGLIVDEARPKIKGVVVTARARRTDSEARELELLVRPDATDYASDVITLDTFDAYQHVWPTDPETADVWEPAGVDGTQVGIRATIAAE